MARFEPWQGERLILDAANELAENLATLDRYLLQD